MKNKYILSAIIAASLFAVSYAVLNLNILLALGVGVAAYYASYMVIPNKKIIIEETKNIEDIVEYGYMQVKAIRDMIPKLEDDNLKANIKALCNDTEKILKEVKNKPKKSKQIQNFISYYLPLTVQILKQYDEVENQRLTSKDSKEFMQKVLTMSEKIREATANQLNSMYNEEIINTNAEIKVFESMLNSDGLLNSNIKIEEKKEEKEVK